ncbi:MAG: dTDP-4-dehydrorhamnose reductase, partial [Phycisphaerales bacterium]
ELGMAVNGKAPGHIAQVCAQISAVLVHFGTDFIFDGRSDRPYRPDDPANPLSVYGQSKWEGEQAVRAAGCHHLIVRTSWLFGPFGHNFVEAILGQAQRGESLKVVSDELGRPTLASDLAEAVVRLLDAGARETVHFANAGQCSWFEFAREIVAQSGLDVPVTPISSDALNRAARRPAYSALDTSRYTELTGHTAAEWSEALRRYLASRSKPFGTASTV